MSKFVLNVEGARTIKDATIIDLYIFSFPTELKTEKKEILFTFYNENDIKKKVNVDWTHPTICKASPDQFPLYVSVPWRPDKQFKLVALVTSNDSANKGDYTKYDVEINQSIFHI